MAHFEEHHELTDDAVISFFTESMKEEGVEPDDVELMTWDEPFQQNIAFIVTKHINGRPEQLKTTTSTNVLTKNIDTIRSEVAMCAHNTASKFEEMMVEHIDTCGTRLTFCSAEGGWAKCQLCKTEVHLSDLVREGPVFAADAELSCPSPTPYDIEDFLRRCDSASIEVLKLYLFGALRKKCGCDFGKREPWEVPNRKT